MAQGVSDRKQGPRAGGWRKIEKDGTPGTGKRDQDWSGKGTEGVGVPNVPERRKTRDRETRKKRGQDMQAPARPPREGQMATEWEG